MDALNALRKMAALMKAQKNAARVLKPGEAQVGDLVVYTRKFLRNTGQQTGASIDGRVVRVTEHGWPVVQWNDHPDGETAMVNPGNIEFSRRNRGPSSKKASGPLKAIHEACGCGEGEEEGTVSEILFDGEMAGHQKLAGGAGSNIRWTNRFFKMFFAEKNLADAHWVLKDREGTAHWISNEAVLEFINKASQRERKSIESMIRRIDVANGDVNDYLKHLAGALINNPDFAGRFASAKAVVSLTKLAKLAADADIKHVDAPQDNTPEDPKAGGEWDLTPGQAEEEGQASDVPDGSGNSTKRASQGPNGHYAAGNPHIRVRTAARGMTWTQALEELKRTRSLNTAMLKPLGLSMDFFLRFGQLPASVEEKAMDKLIATVEKKGRRAAAAPTLYVAVSGGKLLGATDSKSGAKQEGWNNAPRTKEVNSFEIVQVKGVPESLATQLVDFTANNPKTSAWSDEKSAYKAVAKYLPKAGMKFASPPTPQSVDDWISWDATWMKKNAGWNVTDTPETKAAWAKIRGSLERAGFNQVKLEHSKSVPHSLRVIFRGWPGTLDLNWTLGDELGIALSDNDFHGRNAGLWNVTDTPETKTAWAKIRGSLERAGFNQVKLEHSKSVPHSLRVVFRGRPGTLELNWTLGDELGIALSDFHGRRSSSLYEATKKLARENPPLRCHLVPLLKKARQGGRDPVEARLHEAAVQNFEEGPYSENGPAHEKAMKIKRKGGKNVQIKKKKGEWFVTYTADKKVAADFHGRRSSSLYKAGAKAKAGEKFAALGHPSWYYTWPREYGHLPEKDQGLIGWLAQVARNEGVEATNAPDALEMLAWEAGYSGERLGREVLALGKILKVNVHQEHRAGAKARARAVYV